MRRRIVKHLLVFYATVIALMFVAQIFHLSNYLMEEKENGTREGHITIGTNCTLLWLTWEIIYVPSGGTPCKLNILIVLHRSSFKTILDESSAG